MNLEIVVARYNEDLSWLFSPPIPGAKITVYNKGLTSPSCEFIPLPNIGREAHTYLTHIIQNYANLADYIAFIQGNPLPHCKDMRRRLESFAGDEHYTMLSDRIISDDKHGQPHIDILPRHGAELCDAYDFLFDGNHKKFIFGTGSQFIVSRERILSRPKSFYVRCLARHLSVAPLDQDERTFVLERLWPVIFDGKTKARDKASDRLEKQHRVKMTTVIARYKEKLDWLSQPFYSPYNQVLYKLPNPIIYNKGDDISCDLAKVIKLPNIGREAHTYFHHIITHYDELSEYTAFIQGDPFGHTHEPKRKIVGFLGEEEFFWISEWAHEDTMYGWPSCANFLPRNGLECMELYKYLFDGNHQKFHFNAGAQFIVSRERIRFRSKKFYQKCIDRLPTIAPVDGWCFERMWQIIFDGQTKARF